MPRERNSDRNAQLADMLSWGRAETQARIVAYRFPYMIATSPTIISEFDKKFSEQGSILEIGSGTGMLGMMVPDSYSERLIRSDLNLNPLKLQKQTDTESVLLQASAIKLPFEEASFDDVVSLSTFDTIKNVQAAAREIYRVLKPGGWFVHFQDLIPDPDPYIQEFQKEKKIPFPFEKEGRKVAFALVSQESFAKKALTNAGRRIVANSINNGEEMYDLLVRYSRNPLVTHHEIYETAEGADLRVRLHQVGRALSAVKISPQITDSVDILFEKKMKDAFKKARFANITVNYPRETVFENILEAGPLAALLIPDNYFSNDVGVWDRHFSEDVARNNPQGVIQVTSRVQVIAAQK